MTFNGWVQIALFVAILLVLTRPLGGFSSWPYERIGYRTARGSATARLR
jgi:hypothetical protein